MSALWRRFNIFSDGFDPQSLYLTPQPLALGLTLGQATQGELTPRRVACGRCQGLVCIGMLPVEALQGP